MYHPKHHNCRILVVFFTYVGLQSVLVQVHEAQSIYVSYLYINWSIFNHHHWASLNNINYHHSSSAFFESPQHYELIIITQYWSIIINHHEQWLTISNPCVGPDSRKRPAPHGTGVAGSSSDYTSALGGGLSRPLVCGWMGPQMITELSTSKGLNG